MAPRLLGLRWRKSITQSVSFALHSPSVPAYRPPPPCWIVDIPETAEALKRRVVLARRVSIGQLSLNVSRSLAGSFRRRPPIGDWVTPLLMKHTFLLGKDTKRRRRIGCWICDYSHWLPSVLHFQFHTWERVYDWCTRKQQQPMP